ncbi:ParA family protein [Gracilibacillus salinarum]|uniref:ParA family protein n=1 Tax=Gracilibacillus salinarum TaxID=2932255 RepID=A0ABY4GGT5_9BACI|nr:ParA family protein [Gracilibacillus salinarum]UOQ83409.1 ParA family protein [Gracilibacillus salinarum]
MSTVIATINLKGGVAKTTTTVGLAEVLSATYQKRVLVIDLDPQTNATTMLIGEEKWQELNEQEYTLARLFQDAIEPEENRFNLEKTVQQHASNVKEVTSLSLLPSSLDLIDTQDELANVPKGPFYSDNPVDVLKKAIRPIMDQYDYILIDCPPNLGIITLNGLRIADGYLIPTIPDVLSTYGIPQIISRIRSFSETIGEEIEPLGIVITKFRHQSTMHKQTIQQLKREKDARLFDTIFPENNQIASAAEYHYFATLRQKWGYQGQYDQFCLLAREILARYEA